MLFTKVELCLGKEGPRRLEMTPEIMRRTSQQGGHPGNCVTHGAGKSLPFPHSWILPHKHPCPLSWNKLHLAPSGCSPETHPNYSRASCYITQLLPRATRPCFQASRGVSAGPRESACSLSILAGTLPLRKAPLMAAQVTELQT